MKSAFTLIEILLVATLLTVLASVAFPAFRSLSESAEKQRAATQASAIAQAVMSYKHIYGHWPAHDDEAAAENRFLFIATPEGIPPTRKIIKMLIANDAENNNAQNIAFLPDVIRDGESAAENGFLRDPWGNEFSIIMNSPHYEEETSTLHTQRNEGGVLLDAYAVECPHGERINITIETPDNVAVFSWGKQASQKNGTCRCDGAKIVGSWQCN